MRNAFVLARKEMGSYFRTWTGPFIFAFFFLIAGIFFSVLVITYSKISFEAERGAVEQVQGLGLTRFIFSSFYLNLAAILMFVIPLFSMRAIAEERRQETLELLYTYPLSDFQIVFGKFLGMVWLFELLTLPVLLYGVSLAALGAQLEWKVILGGYLGLWLLGNAYLSFGLFVSSLSDNPVSSAIITFGGLAVFWILDWVVGVTDGTLSTFLAAISPLGHYRDFSFGILDLSNMIYFLFFQLYFLFLSLRAVEVRNWKG